MTLKLQIKMAAVGVAAAICFYMAILSACVSQKIPETPAKKIDFTQTKGPTRSQVPNLPPNSPPYYLVPTKSSRDTLNPTQEARAHSIAATEAAWDYQSVPATQSMRSTQLAPFPQSCQPFVTAFLVSPDGHWLAQYCGIDGFMVIGQKGGRSGRVQNRDIFGYSEFYPYNIGGIQPLFWSPDSRYIYFNSHECCIDFVEPYGSFFMHYLTTPLYRLDVQSGIWSKTIKSANDYYLSPTGRRIAYVTMYPPQMNVLDLQNGEIQSFQLGDALAAGYVVWAKDGLTFFFSTNNGPENYHGGDIFDYEIYELDVSSARLTSLHSYPKSPAIIFPIGVTIDDKLVIRMQQWQPDYSESTQYLDLSTKQLMTPTITP